MKLLLLGGSGLISGHLAREAVAAGHEVWAVTRGLRKMDDGVRLIKADRYDADSLRAALESADTKWDAAFDCLCREPAHAQIALDVLPPFVKRYVVVSTDSVYHPQHKRVPQTEETDYYMTDDSYGAQKRRMELLFDTAEGREKLDWTIFRPGHVFGPGSQLGCFPEHMRQEGLLAHMRADKPLRLVGGGKYLLHPIYAKDLALTMLDCLDKPKAVHQIFCIGGPNVIENHEYFECIGRIIGHPAVMEATSEAEYAQAHADSYVTLCQRSYDLTKLREAGIRVPCIPMEIGLRAHIDWLDAQEGRRTVYLAGGCYWGAEKYLSNIKGVLETEVGFANGDTHNPTYKQVRYENTNHAETVRVVYDPTVLPLEKLLRLFWRIIDPVSVDKQGEDEGHQYRTGVYHTLVEDAPVIRAELAKLQTQYAEPLAVEACELEHFYSAEEYHQKYLDKNPGGYCHVPWAAINAVKDVDLKDV